MSVISLLVIQPDRLPSFEAIKREAEASGEAIEFDEPVDFSSHTGFLPVRVHGQETGFEYYFEPVPTDGLPTEATAFGTHHIVTRTGSDFKEGRAALLYLKVAARLSGGAYVYPEDAIIIPPDEVQAYLGEQVQEFDSIIQKDEERDAAKAQRAVERADTQPPPPKKPSGFFSRLFGKKD